MVIISTEALRVSSHNVPEVYSLGVLTNSQHCDFQNTNCRTVCSVEKPQTAGMCASTTTKRPSGERATNPAEKARRPCLVCPHCFTRLVLHSAFGSPDPHQSLVLPQDLCAHFCVHCCGLTHPLLHPPTCLLRAFKTPLGVASWKLPCCSRLGPVPPNGPCFSAPSPSQWDDLFRTGQIQSLQIVSKSGRGLACSNLSSNMSKLKLKTWFYNKKVSDTWSRLKG